LATLLPRIKKKKNPFLRWQLLPELRNHHVNGKTKGKDEKEIDV
jgi:hypothetical protein